MVGMGLKFFREMSINNGCAGVINQVRKVMRFFVFLLGAMAYFTQPVTAIAAETKKVTVKSTRGVSQPFLFVLPDNPKAGVILFVGGDGRLKLSSSGKINASKGNFFSRTYNKFSDQGLMVALVDIPSDKKKLNAIFRVSKKHAGDMIAVINYMQKKADVPIWMVGTSMGSYSAASVAIKKQKKVAGLVLTSSVTRPEIMKELKKIAKKFPGGVAGMNLKKFKKPVLIVSEEKDTCKVSPPEDSAKLKEKFSNSPRVEVVMLKGGIDVPKANVCHGKSRHGFNGIETEAVKRIAAFITQ